MSDMCFLKIIWVTDGKKLEEGKYECGQFLGALSDEK
jgi:hypothetical protein